MISQPMTVRVSVRAEVTLLDGTQLTGFLFVEEDSRIQDLLNDNRPFFPFVTENDEVYILNKQTVTRVRAFD